MLVVKIYASTSGFFDNLIAVCNFIHFSSVDEQQHFVFTYNKEMQNKPLFNINCFHVDVQINKIGPLINRLHYSQQFNQLTNIKNGDKSTKFSFKKDQNHKKVAYCKFCSEKPILHVLQSDITIKDIKTFLLMTLKFKT